MHIIQIPSAAPSFLGIWAIRIPLKIHFYTCMSFTTCWSRLSYTKLSLHQSFVINMYVVTMVWHCISPWSFHRSSQRRREMDIFRFISRFPRILSKNNQKKKKKRREENFDWTFVNTYMKTLTLQKSIIWSERPYDRPYTSHCRACWRGLASSSHSTQLRMNAHFDQFVFVL